MVSIRRKIYLIDAGFQLKFSFYVCVLILISSLIYPVTIYELINRLIHDIATTPSLKADLKEQKDALISVLIMWQIGYTALVFVICIFFSHKIAGPLYKVKKYLSKIKEGNKPERLIFRRGDYFSDLAENFNEAFEKISEGHSKHYKTLREINNYLVSLSEHASDDDKKMLKEAANKLSEIQKSYEDN